MPNFNTNCFIIRFQIRLSVLMSAFKTQSVVVGLYDATILYPSQVGLPSQGRVQEFSTGGGDVGLIACYTDREDLEGFILSKTGGERGGGGVDRRHAPASTCLFTRPGSGWRLVYHVDLIIILHML